MKRYLVVCSCSFVASTLVFHNGPIMGAQEKQRQVKALWRLPGWDREAGSDVAGNAEGEVARERPFEIGFDR